MMPPGTLPIAHMVCLVLGESRVRLRTAFLQFQDNRACSSSECNSEEKVRDAGDRATPAPPAEEFSAYPLQGCQQGQSIRSLKFRLVKSFPNEVIYTITQTGRQD